MMFFQTEEKRAFWVLCKEIAARDLAWAKGKEVAALALEKSPKDRLNMKIYVYSLNEYLFYMRICGD